MWRKSRVAESWVSSTCIELARHGEAVAVMVTHLLDAVPTEAHVFWSLWAGAPFYVSTPPNGTVWSVAEGRVKLLQRK